MKEKKIYIKKTLYSTLLAWSGNPLELGQPWNAVGCHREDIPNGSQSMLPGHVPVYTGWKKMECSPVHGKSWSNCWRTVNNRHLLRRFEEQYLVQSDHWKQLSLMTMLHYMILNLFSIHLHQYSKLKNCRLKVLQERDSLMSSTHNIIRRCCIYALN